MTVARRPRVRTRGAANDRRADEGCGVLLIAIANAVSIRRSLGFDAWSDEFLSFLTAVKTLSGGRLSNFAWDTVCLVFDPVNSDDFDAKFRALAEFTGTPCGSTEPMILDHVAAGALGDNELDALERAEKTLIDAKSRGLSIMASPGSAALRGSQIDLTSDLALAIARDEFFLVYQPKVNVRRQTVSSAEALIRWRHPVHGMIMPDSFIALADTCGEMRAITLWTLRRVIADQVTLGTAGHHLRIFINISGGLLTDRTFIDAACALVEEAGAEIGFEITETAVIRDPDVAIENLERCAAIGITLAIDDYGSGLSSLSYLKRLPATELKIDKMFVTHLTSSHRDPLIVRSTIDLAHALDMEVTAEGVETPAALALLTVMGCEMVQGYLISVPLELADFVDYLETYRFEALQTSVEPTVYRPASFWKRA